MTRPSLRSRIRNFATYVDGVRSCAAALENGRRPSRQSTIDAGFEPGTFDSIRLG
jgi:hypothetical protein